MQYRLRDGLSCCFVEGHPIFIDIRNDRYFMLPAVLEHAFAAHIQGHEPSAAPLPALLDKKILIPTTFSHCSDPAPATESATRSAMEEETGGEGLSALVYFEVLSIVCKIRHRLRTMGLYALLNDLAVHRRNKVSFTETVSCKSIEADIVTAANQFRYTRNWVPVGRTCLIDSLSLVTYLANRHLPANVVFGVALSPFSAHCWAQFRHIALNETIMGAAAHTQILVW
jgi:hypothetical protein